MQVCHQVLKSRLILPSWKGGAGGGLLALFLLVPLLSSAQTVQIVRLPELMEAVQTDTLHVVNFWATWCAPCVKELPHFEELGLEMASDKVKVTLVSLDYADRLDSRVLPFVKEKGLRSRLLLLDERDPNQWIPAIDTTWTGSIPATAIYRNGQRLGFAEREFDAYGLKAWVRSFLGE